MKEVIVLKFLGTDDTPNPKMRFQQFTIKEGYNSFSKGKEEGHDIAQKGAQKKESYHLTPN